MSYKWEFESEFNFGDTDFAKIYRFYVIETPVKGTSVRGFTFEDRHCNMNSLSARLKRVSPFLKDNWYVCKNKDVTEFLRKSKILNRVNYDKEIVVHTINRKHCGGKTDSLFYAIRCSFAHGSFDIRCFRKCKYYILENKDQGKLKARMILKEETLLKWIDVINELTDKNKNNDND